MIINLRRSIGLIAVGLLSRPLLWAGPTQITNLSALTGTSPNSIILTWTVPTGGAMKYILKYNTGHTLITDDTMFNAALRIEDPPLNLPSPYLTTPALPTSYTVTGLQAGVDYSFAIKSEDSVGSQSLLSNGATAQASLPCGIDPGDGKGTATIIPGVIPSGDMTVATITYVAGPLGLNVGGIISLQIPDLFFPPQTTNQYMSGYVTAIATGGVTFTSAISGQRITFTIAGANISSGATITFNYLAQTCSIGNSVTFRVFTQKQTCGILTEIAASPSVTTGPGKPSFLAFEPYEIVAVVNSVSTVETKVKDNCWNTVNATTTIPLTLKTERQSGGNFITDTFAALSTSTSMSNPSTTLTSSILNGTSGRTFYYRITTDSQQPNYVRINFNSIQQGLPYSFLASVRPLQNGIMQSSIDKGTLDSTQKTVTFDPGKNEKAYVNFRLDQDLNWRVLFSTDSAFGVVTKTIYGFGKTVRTSWDGMSDPLPGQPPLIAAPGTYAVRIIVGNDVKDDSLTAIIATAGMQGLVQQSGSTTTIEGVDIEFYGTTSRYTRSLSDGTFKIYGLSAGTYRVRFFKSGYVFKEVTATVSAGATTALGTVQLTQAAILRLYVVRPSNGTLPDITGTARANTLDYSKQAFGTVRFRDGKTTSDASDDWNTIPTPYTDLFLEPSVAYNVTIEVQSHTPMTFSATLPVGVTSSTKTLTREPMVEGLISFPPGGNTQGNWVSVEAAIDANSDLVPDSNDPSQRRYGGVYVPANQTGATYRVFGLPDGKYVLTAFASGFARNKQNVTVAGSDILNANFPAFAVGGKIMGTLTINGDTSSLGGSNGKVNVSINAYAPSRGDGGWTNVTVDTNSVSASSTYTITGLDDGAYFVNTHLAGFGLNVVGQPTVSVSGGVGNLDLTLEKFTGRLTGNIILPSGRSDYGTVQIEALPHNNYGETTPTAVISTPTYTINGLGTDFYSLRARYPYTGLVVNFSVPVTNGRTTARDIDLSGNTYSISGTVSSSASAPYTVSYIVTSSTPTATQTPSGSGSLPANRIMARSLRNRDFNAGTTATNAIFYDPKETFVGTYDADKGTYTITGLGPGSYLLTINGEIDGSLSDGNEISPTQKVVTITNANATGVDFNLTDGYKVTGTLRVASGVSETGRNLQVRLVDSDDTTVAYQNVNLSGTSVDFSISKVRAGNYLLTVSDSFPKKYASKDKSIQIVAADVTNQELQLVNAANIKGKLQIKKSGVVISASNYSQYLASGYRIEARSNPWIPGGYASAESPLINSNGEFVIAANPGTYDVVLYNYSPPSESDIASGKKQFVSFTKSSIEVSAGETKDIGFIPLDEGADLTGTVRDSAGNALPNLRVKAISVKRGDHGNDQLEAFTDANGKYVLRGLSLDDRYYRIVASPRPDPFDTRFLGDPGTGRYGQVIRGPIDVQSTTNVDFTLELANGSISATVVTSDGGTALIPFGEKTAENLPGMMVILNKQPDIPQDNPLGDLMDKVGGDGLMNVKGLAPGTYNVYILARGYGSVTRKNVIVTANGNTNLGTLTLPAGYTLSGKIAKSNGQLVNKRELDTVLAVRDNFKEISISKVITDAAGNILEYSIAGIQANKAYTILGFDESDSIVNLASNVTLNSDTNLDLVFKAPTPGARANVLKNADRTFTVLFKFDDALRKSAQDLDSDGTVDDDEIMTLTAGNGSLGATEISNDRTEAKVTYTPGSGDTSFTITLNATFVTKNETTGANNTVSGPFTFFTGIARRNTATISNVGGDVDLAENSDASGVQFSPGYLGDDDTATAEIAFQAADTASDAASASSSRLGVMKVAAQLGIKAYPAEMGAAMTKLKSLDIDPFSSFYDIFLPAGVSHFFPQGKEARLCLIYDASATDPSSLNIYYYNSATNEYVLEAVNKNVDTENQKICVDISHASVFTVFDSSASILTGDSYTGELAVINFPNPFNLKSKTVTLQNPGSATASQTIEGTMIKISVPPTMSGAVELQIFNVAGELVRTIHTDVTGGAHYYVQWDGKNDGGQKVASGTYIARFTVGGANEKFFKMAVLK